MHKTARFSLCGGYRWLLTRSWSKDKSACFVGLNPSTADAEEDDPTIRRMTGFAGEWGCGSILVVNLFSLRSTDPLKMKQHASPVGLATDAVILRAVRESTFTVCCWGVHGSHAGRDEDVLAKLWRYLPKLQCLGLTKDGHPKHPLYLAKSTQLIGFP